MTIAAASSGSPVRLASPVERVRNLISIVPITIEQYQKMIEQQIVPEDSTVELLRGILVRKDRSVIGEDPRGHSSLHSAIIASLTALATKINNATSHLRIQLPIICPPASDPEPDGAIMRGPPLEYLARLPNASTDVTCIIEAAHRSLERDRKDKLPIYAASGVPQYIIINLVNKTLEIYTDPDRRAEEYRTKATLTAGQKLTLLLPTGTLDIAADEILP